MAIELNRWKLIITGNHIEINQRSVFPSALMSLLVQTRHITRLRRKVGLRHSHPKKLAKSCSKSGTSKASRGMHQVAQETDRFEHISKARLEKHKSERRRTVAQLKDHNRSRPLALSALFLAEHRPQTRQQFSQRQDNRSNRREGHRYHQATHKHVGTSTGETSVSQAATTTW